jgi:hypothetical protein
VFALCSDIAEAVASMVVAHQGRLGASRDLFVCAENALLRGERDAAMLGLERAVAAGWREYHLHERDPCWASVRDDTQYRKLMARVRADVDRQRAEIERRDAAQALAARADAPGVAAGNGTE